MNFRRIYMANEPDNAPIADPLAEGIVVGPDVNTEPKKEEAPKQ